MSEHSIIHDSIAREIIVGTGKWAGIVIAGAAIAYVSGGAA